MDIRPETVLVRSKDPVVVEVDQTLVMLGLEQGKYYGMEGVAGRIWALLEEPRSVRDLSTTLAAEYEIDAETCLAEITDFLDELAREKLVRIAG